MKKIILSIFTILLLINCNEKSSNSENKIIEAKMSKLIEAFRTNDVELLKEELPTTNDLEKVFLSSKMDENDRYNFTHPYFLKKDLVSYLKEIKEDFEGSEKEWTTIKPYISIFGIKDKKGLQEFSGKLRFATDNGDVYKLNIGFVLLNEKVYIIGTDNDIDKTGTKEEILKNIPEMKKMISEKTKEANGVRVGIIIFE